MSSVLVVGSVALDTVETPLGRKHEMLGGSATYFSLAASHFAPVRLVAVVGKDFPDDARNLLESKQIDLAGLQMVDGKTFRWTGEYRGRMNEAITHDTQLNVFSSFQPVIPERFTDSEWVFLGNINPALQLRVLSQIKNPKWVALDTMNFWIDSALDKLMDVLKKIDMLIINEGELQLLTGKTALRSGVKTLMTMGPKSLIIKRGEYGSALYHSERWFFAPGFPDTDVVDPTGAGDSFAGGFMGSLAKDGVITTQTLRKAIINGSVIASYNITDFGPWKLAALDQNSINARYNDFIGITTVR
jgi:sugar/nucleoside kinase (ribokinase family)